MSGRNFGSTLAELLVQLARDGSITTFVETGTLHGETAQWAADHFNKVITIELAEEMHRKARNYSTASNIQFIHGKSQEELEPIVRSTSIPMMFYLDAHCGFAKEQADQKFSVNQYDSQGEPISPLLNELTTLEQSLPNPLDHVIVIDDAVRFLRPPPIPFPRESMPSIQEVVASIEEISKDYYIVVFRGHLIAVPPKLKKRTQERIRMYTSTSDMSYTQKKVKWFWETIILPTAKYLFKSLP